jgi:hypothetical protein
METQKLENHTKPRGRPPKKQPEERRIINENLYQQKLEKVREQKKIARERSKYKDIVINRVPITISFSIY